MAAAGAETVSNGGCGPDDRLYLEGNPLEDRPKLEKFIDRFKEAGMVSTCLALFGIYQLLRQHVPNTIYQPGFAVAMCKTVIRRFWLEVLW